MNGRADCPPPSDPFCETGLNAVANPAITIVALPPYHTARFDESALSALVRNDGARSSNTDGLSLTYPFDKQTRSAESSRTIAKEIGLR